MRPQDLLPDSSSSILVVMRRLGACLQGAQRFVCAMLFGLFAAPIPPIRGLIVSAIWLTLIVRLSHSVMQSTEYRLKWTI